MAKKITVIITGDRKLNQKLHRITTKEQKRAFRNAARPAIKPVMQQARSNTATSNVTGKLSKSIKVRSQRRSRSSIGVRVTTREEDFPRTFYAAFQEFGWKAGSNRRPIKGKEDIKRAAATKQTSVMEDYKRRLKSEIEKAAKR